MEKFLSQVARQPTASKDTVKTTTTTSTQAFPMIEVTKTALVNDNNGSGSNDLGDKISDSIQDPEEYLKGFALLKNPKLFIGTI